MASGVTKTVGTFYALASALPVLPAPGRLLVEVAPFGAALVERDGQVRHMGDWHETAFSPDGARVVGARGGRLAVLDLDGKVAWSVRRSPSPTGTQPDWSPDGRRIAYRSGADLRVIGARGGADHRVARRLRFTGPRWRPRNENTLAWADQRGRVQTLDVVAHRTLWRSAPGPPVRPGGLRWSPDGMRLAAISGSLVRVFDASGRLVQQLRARVHDHFQTGTFTRSEPSRLVLVHHDFTRGRTRVTMLSCREREIFAGRGSTVDVTPSPDGRYLLLGRRTADEWRFLPLVPMARTVVVESIARRINSRARGRWAFPATRDWNASHHQANGAEGFGVSSASVGCSDAHAPPASGAHNTASWRAADRNQSALSFEGRSRVSKST